MQARVASFVRNGEYGQADKDCSRVERWNPRVPRNTSLLHHERIHRARCLGGAPERIHGGI